MLRSQGRSRTPLQILDAVAVGGLEALTSHHLMRMEVLPKRSPGIVFGVLPSLTFVARCA